MGHSSNSIFYILAAYKKCPKKSHRATNWEEHKMDASTFDSVVVSIWSNWFCSYSCRFGHVSQLFPFDLASMFDVWHGCDLLQAMSIILFLARVEPLDLDCLVMFLMFLLLHSDTLCLLHGTFLFFNLCVWSIVLCRYSKGRQTENYVYWWRYTLIF
jgi:hypothetical protein